MIAMLRHQCEQSNGKEEHKKKTYCDAIYKNVFRDFRRYVIELVEPDVKLKTPKDVLQ